MESPLTPRSINAMSPSTNEQGDYNPRPTKRARLEPGFGDALPVHEFESQPTTKESAYKPLSPTQLLLSLPSLLSHPPTHKNHMQALHLSRVALKASLANASKNGMDKLTECKAWTELAEVGFKIGLNAEGVEGDVEKGVTKAVSCFICSSASSALY